jgi:hypothetical protein
MSPVPTPQAPLNFGQPAAAPAPVAVPTPLAAPAPVAAVVAAAPQPVAAPAPVAQPVAAVPVAQQVPGAAQAPLNGGAALSGVMGALMAAKSSGGGGKQDLPAGKGLYLLKEGKFALKSDGAFKVTEFILFCLKGVSDAVGIPYGTEGYSGPIPGETYKTTLWHKTGPKELQRTVDTNLRALRACWGVSQEKIEAYQSSPESAVQLNAMMTHFLGLDLDTGIPTGNISSFSNQAIVEIQVKPVLVELKDKITKQPLFLEGGVKATKVYTNEYWNGKVPIGEAAQMIDGELFLRAFGGQEAYAAAFASEQSYMAV